jgi:hypothetical protein
VEGHAIVRESAGVRAVKPEFTTNSLGGELGRPAGIESGHPFSVVRDLDALDAAMKPHYSDAHFVPLKPGEWTEFDQTDEESDLI